MTALAVDAEAVDRAAARLEGTVNRTPVVSRTTLDELAGRPVHLKCENLQRGGAFKFRGAFNALSEAAERGPLGHVVTYSSGNHGIAVSLAAMILGARATVVCPTDAPQEKRARITALGARIVDYDRLSEDRVAVAETLARAEAGGGGGLLVPPYDLAAVIAGQGTVGRELVAQIGVGELDAVVVPVGGGGLVSGIAVAVKAARPGVRVIGVEPEIASDTAESLRAGRRVQIPPPETIADGLRSTSPGELTFPIIQELVDDVVLVSEADIRGAMAAMFSHAHVVCEPSGAVALAAVLSGHVAGSGAVCAVVSGGNVSLERFHSEMTS